MLYNIFLLLVSSFFFLTINTAAGQEKRIKQYLKRVVDILIKDAEILI